MVRWGCRRTWHGVGSGWICCLLCCECFIGFLIPNKNAPGTAEWFKLRLGLSSPRVQRKRRSHKPVDRNYEARHRVRTAVTFHGSTATQQFLFPFENWSGARENKSTPFMPFENLGTFRTRRSNRVCVQGNLLAPANRSGCAGCLARSGGGLIGN